MYSASRFCQSFLLFIAFATSAPAAIVVNGVADKLRYDGSVTFNVVSEPNYITTAALDGQPVPVGAPVTVNSVQFHELTVQKQLSLGGAVEALAIRFIVRNSVRISTEDGIPTFTPPPLVNDAAASFSGGTLTVIAPAQFPKGLPVPVAAYLRDLAGQPLWLNGTISAAAFPASPLTVHRGWGATFLPASSIATTTIYEARVASLGANAPIAIEANTTWIAKSGAIGSQDWGANARIDITATLTLSAGATVRIGPGSVIRIAPGAALVVDGATLNIAGSTSAPVVFTPQSLSQPWGGIRLTSTAGSTLTATGAIFSGSGADPLWFNTHAGYSVHRKEEACLLVDTGASATLTNCFMLRLAGQAMHLKNGTLKLTDCLIQNATTGGELTGGTFTALRCGFFEFPDTSTNFEDGDNDALYLVPGGANIYTVERCAIGLTKDDGIDTAAGTINVIHCWIEDCFHEAFSPSTSGHVSTSTDSVFFHCGQGLEHGYGSATTTSNHCLMLGCENGIRTGDNYGAPTFTDYSGHLTAQNCISIYNQFQDVWGYEWNSWTYRTDRMTVNSNYFTAANPLHPGNLTWNPVANGSLLEPFMPVPGSLVGVAITGVPRQSSILEYPAAFQVRLSTFSSKPVSVTYSLVSDPATSTEAVVSAGVVQFAAGETLKTLDLPVSGNPGFLRLSLNQPVNAEITGHELYFFKTSAAPPSQTLIPKRAAGWLYQALRAEPAGTWRALSYSETAWQQNKLAPIGFGDIGAGAPFLVLGTTLNATESGSSTDRTRAIYFRKHFQLADPSLVSALTLSLLRDDGVVAYLNGLEVGRNNIDTGTVTGGIVSYSTLATRTIDTAEESVYIDLPVAADVLAALQPGDNVLVLEVHQASATSGDLVLDAELSAQFHPPVRDIHGIGAGVEAPFLYWLDPAWQLQQSPDLSTWSTIPNSTSPWTVPHGAPRTFFRLVR